MKPLKILWYETCEKYGAERAQDVGRKLGIEVDAINGYDLELIADGDRIGITAHGRNLAQHYDVLVVRSFMPFISETITLARLFREAGKMVIDESVTDEGYAMAKIHDYVIMASRGVAVPRTQQYFILEPMKQAAQQMGYPCILKGNHGSQGNHVFKIHSEAELQEKWAQYMPGETMVQEYLEAEVDYRVIVIGYKALPVYVSRRPRPGDFRTNFEHNEEVIALPMAEAPQLQDVAERAARALRREFSGVDIRCRGHTPLVLEANRRPGFKDFERITGYDVVTDFITYIMQKYQNQV